MWLFFPTNRLYIIAIAACFFSFAIPKPCFGSSPILDTADLAKFLQTDRLIVVFSGNREKMEEFLDQWDSVEIHKRMNHRSLLLFQVDDTKIIKDLRNELSPGESGFRIWLIGMNGHLLLTTSEVLQPEDIFDRIDALPGRKAEIHRYNNWMGGMQTDP